ncbi:CG13033 [Drosophila busckii]|uniref:CG13033 n=1 Tax=Drosophila busckii TaxID=30019 RepID=A0A0M4EIB2_DROBS|nr:CG13033 [Drosophila busckii]
MCAICLLLCVLCVAQSLPLARLSRDVSHLPLEYLPPVVLPPLPSRDYLPPVEQHAASLSHVLQPPHDYLPPNNEYLPPAEKLQEATTEEVPTTTEIATTAEPESEAELTTVAPLELPAGTLDAAGYHYDTPADAADLSPVVVGEYLPPLDDNAVLESLPGSDESAALLADGYHYRAIRRLRH